MKKQLTLFVITCAFFSGPINAGAGKPDSDIEAVTFIKEAYKADMAQIVAGNLALKNAHDGGVKSYGSQMAADHAQINAQLNQLILVKNYTLSKKDNANIEVDKNLTKSTGTDFDAYYLNQTALIEREMIALYQSALINIDDPDIQRFAKKNLPLLKGHLSSLTALSSQLNIKLNR
jgi:putative membrane protein